MDTCLCSRHLIPYTKVLSLCMLLLMHIIHAKPLAIKKEADAAKLPLDENIMDNLQHVVPEGVEEEKGALGKPDSQRQPPSDLRLAADGDVRVDTGQLQWPPEVRKAEENRGLVVEGHAEEGDNDGDNNEYNNEDNDGDEEEAGAGDNNEQLAGLKPKPQEEEDEEDIREKHHPVAEAIKAAGKLLPLDDLRLPDHLEGVRMEQDGHLNREYRHEILLGDQHEEFEEGSDDEKDDKLTAIFHKVDVNKDLEVSLMELETWIQAKVQEHFSEAQEETKRIFSHLDADKNGLVAWEEFHIHFLLAKGHSEENAKKHVMDYETVNLDPDEKERLIRYKFRWAEADEEPQDNQLTMLEFASFRHPEQSASMLDRMVAEIVDNLDQNDDGIIVEAEFVALPPGEVDYSFQDSDKVWQTERRREFRDVIDLNKDGKLTKDEIKNYVDPQNPNHARMEAENLIQLADSDQDKKLSLSEMLDNAELFLGSKVVHAGRSFHDEF